MVAFLVINKDRKVRNEYYNMLDRYNRSPPKNQSKIGYDSLIENVIPKEFINLMGTTKTDFDVELKMRISRIEYLKRKTNSQVIKIVW